MKKFCIAAALIILFGCVKKLKEQIEYNLIKDAITKGTWKVTKFTRDNVDVTTDFSPYKFQFKEDFTVDAMNNGTVEKTGTWNADTSASTISSNFSNAVNPLVLLNGTWKLIDNSWTYVLAKQTVNGEYRELKLEKE
jgi:hypothetical protein